MIDFVFGEARVAEALFDHVAPRRRRAVRGTRSRLDGACGAEVVLGAGQTRLVRLRAFE